MSVFRGITKAKMKKKITETPGCKQAFGILFLDKITCGGRGGAGRIRGDLREGGLV